MRSNTFLIPVYVTYATVSIGLIVWLARTLFHNGAVFLNNTGGIVQALDGRTGNLIWEQRLGVNLAMRGMSLYDDKLYVATSDAHLVAIDARTGKVVWNVAMPDGRGSSSGPLLARGKVIQVSPPAR